MNVTRIQQEIIKDVLAGKGSKYIIQRTDIEVLISEGHLIYALSNEDYLLKTDRLKDVKSKGVTMLSKCLDESKNGKPAVKTGNMRQTDKGTLLELKCDDEFIYLDQALLKYYDKSAEFEGTNGHSPVYIYEDDILVGCVLPVEL